MSHFGVELGRTFKLDGEHWLSLGFGSLVGPENRYHQRHL